MIFLARGSDPSPPPERWPRWSGPVSWGQRHRPVFTGGWCRPTAIRVHCC